jgi:hypothetical protein
MDTPSREAIINGLAQQMGLPVVLEDADQQLIAYSPHYELTDRIRRDTIMRQTTTQEIVDYFTRWELEAREEPFTVPGDPDEDILPRLCIPIRYHGVTLGFAWVLLPDERVSAQQMAAAQEAAQALTASMLAESRLRANETETVLSLLSSDDETRILGLTDTEVRGVFEPGTRCGVIVCVGPRWDDPAVRTSFWSASWGPSPRGQLRAVTPAEGIAVVAIEQFTAGSRNLLQQAREQVVRAGQDGDGALVIGVGSLVEGPAQAHRAYREARLAARVAARAHGKQNLMLWDDMGVYRILAQMPHEVLGDAVDPRLRALVSEAPDLVGTLECYLDHAGAIAPVAEALHVHRTTLYYRLERASRYGLDLGRGEDRLAVHAGLRALRILGEWPLRRESLKAEDSSNVED